MKRVLMVVIFVGLSVTMLQADTGRVHLDEATDGQIMKELFGLSNDQMQKLAAAYGEERDFRRPATAEEIKDMLKQMLKNKYKAYMRKAKVDSVESTIPSL